MMRAVKRGLTQKKQTLLAVTSSSYLWFYSKLNRLGRQASRVIRNGQLPEAGRPVARTGS